MKKKISYLFARLQMKYAGLDASTILPEVQSILKTNIANASTRPETGLIPFMKMLKADNASLSISIARNGDEVICSNVIVSPSSVSAKYSKLPEQIEKYLSGHLELFPTMRGNESVNYSNLTIPLEFGGNGGMLSLNK
jgi:hypothetical protein